jgi:hypothetical protein
MPALRLSMPRPHPCWRSPWNIALSDEINLTTNAGGTLFQPDCTLPHRFLDFTFPGILTNPSLNYDVKAGH